MDPEKEKASFRIEPKARSFRPYDFGLGDVPWLIVAIPVVMLVLGAVFFVFEQGAALLPPHVRDTMIGFAIGFFVGVRVCEWSRRRSQSRTPLE